MLKYFVDWLIYDLLNLAKDNKLGTMLNFFIYDSLKILFLDGIGIPRSLLR